MAKKIYIVINGRKNGIFDDWDDCKNSVNGYPSAKYKSFKNEEDINKEKEYKEFYEKEKNIKNKSSEIKENNIEQKNINKEIIQNSISVDGACSGNPGEGEYQCVDTMTKEKIFSMSGFKMTTNNIMEFLALVEALKYMLKQKKEYRKVIYSDSITAISWVSNKKIKTTLTRTIENEDTFFMLEEAEKWLKKSNSLYEVLPLIQKWDTKSWGEIPADFGRK